MVTQPNPCSVCDKIMQLENSCQLSSVGMPQYNLHGGIQDMYKLNNEFEGFCVSWK